VKDLFDTAGLETTYGSAIFAGHVPAETATAVRLLDEAGYGVIGKAGLHEFAYGTTSENPHYGDVSNPSFPGRIAGGSSGGSAAALTAGLAEAALGTDSAGSIRIPAACCGVVGHKPTHGLVPLDGCWPLAASFDTAGPLAHDVGGCEQMLEALVPGFEPRELGSLEEVEVRSSARASRRPSRGSRADGRSTCRSSRTRLISSSGARSQTSTGSSSPRTRISTARTSGSRSRPASASARPTWSGRFAPARSTASRSRSSSRGSTSS
jgi:Asp-tRNA(Asn)/Glu-tRNA(Gln) amidotransferase A subunit family amidase